jgi:hypothetical protein
MAKSKPLPPAPPTSAVIRAGLRDASDEQMLRHAVQVATAAFTWSGTKLEERVIGVPESQMDKLQHYLRSYNLHGFRCRPKPDGLNLGDGQEYNERKLIENPGQIAISDADFGQWAIENPRASYKLTPPQFGSEFEDASQHAARTRVKIWGFCYRQTQGPFIGRQGMHASVGTSADGFIVSGQKYPLAAFYLRNLMIFHKTAKGSWGSLPLLEELYRALSELSFDSASLGRYHGIRVRFPDERTNKDYRKNPDWKEGRRRLNLDFGRWVEDEFPAVFKVKRKPKQEQE